MLLLIFVFKMDYNLIWEKRRREIMRKLKRIIIMICTTFFVVLLFQVGTHAAGNDFLTYSGTQSGIDMGFDTMNEARNNCYTYELPNSSGVIASNATITKAYDFHIYKIHINDTGYYSFYTTGDSDTMIRVYREKMILWWMDSFPAIGDTVDDGSRADSNKLNAVKVQDITLSGYYYVVVRLYSSRTGKYTLHVEPNRDLIYIGDYVENGNVKNNKYNVHLWDKQHLTFGESLSQVWLSEKMYYTTEETLLYYWLMAHSLQNMEIDITELINSKMSDTSWAMINNYVNSEVVNSKLRYFIDAENILKVYDINTDIAVGISSFIMGLCGPEGKVASFFYSTILEIFDQVVSMKPSLVNSFFEKIGKECQIKTRLTSLSKEGLTSIMTTERNLCVERWFTNTLTMQYSYSVSSYSKNETLIYGQEYTDGIWS